MSAEMLETFDTWATPGVSEFARRIAEDSSKIDYRFQESITLGQVGKGVFNELDAVYEECGKADWDGYGAMPVLPEAYVQTRIFLESLELGTPPASIGAEPDGHLTLEWHHSRRRTLSVSIDSDGNLYYAVLMGRRRQSGSEPIYARSSTIERLIGEVLGA